MNNKAQITFLEARQIADIHGTPLMVVSKKKLKEKIELFRRYLPQVKIYYAVKSNPAEGIIQFFLEQGIFFDVASSGEIRQLAHYNIPGEQMIYANPVKVPRGLEAARNHRVTTMTFDSTLEIEKMAKSEPGARVLLRIQITNPDALVDLNTKFGIPPEKALGLCIKARDAGLDMAGLCFHVGSQCSTTEGYQVAMEACRNLFAEASNEGIPLRILDIGGGFPIEKNGYEPDIECFLEEISNLLEQYFPNTEIWAEPGRFLSGEAGTVIASVVGITERMGKPFYTVDDGVYGVFSGKIFDHWNCIPRIEKEGSEVFSCLAGPSCDSIDVLLEDYPLPPLEYGDLLIFDNAGAYTSASATTFNGFSVIKTVMVD